MPGNLTTGVLSDTCKAWWRHELLRRQWPPCGLGLQVQDGTCGLWRYRLRRYLWRGSCLQVYGAWNCLPTDQKPECLFCPDEVECCEGWLILPCRFGQKRPVCEFYTLTSTFGTNEDAPWLVVIMWFCCILLHCTGHMLNHGLLSILYQFCSVHLCGTIYEFLQRYHHNYKWIWYTTHLRAYPWYSIGRAINKVSDISLRCWAWDLK